MEDFYCLAGTREIAQQYQKLLGLAPETLRYITDLERLFGLENVTIFLLPGFEMGGAWSDQFVMRAIKRQIKLVHMEQLQLQ